MPTATDAPGTGAPNPADAADLLVEAAGLCKAYGPVPAVADLSFVVRRGEVLGLLGPNGAGKSTALRMLIGFQYPDAGSIRLHGHDVLAEGREARQRLGYLPESVPLYAEMPVRRYLAFFAGLKQVPDPGHEVERVIAQLDLDAVRHRPCGNLSRGYRQRVGLAQALLGNPDILILDEPTSGLDPNQIHDFRALLRELGRSRAVLLSTHILSEALEVCDRVLIMSRGRTVGEGHPGELAGTNVAVQWARLRCPDPPSGEEAARFGLVEQETASSPHRVYELRRGLPRAEARALLELSLAREWELLEWGTGSAGLEAIFRRLTLQEDER